ncbi:MAG: Rrf2 family transcriptional regulator [Deltaproteobacteria bacterium]|nr:Rrf2 family transcriptional regulator [Deltaproteobacteria bacterium]
MHITQWGEYGLHCATFIADRQRAGSDAVPAVEIAEAQKIPVDYAQQILQRLRKNSIVKSVRGPQGGYLLSRQPSEITVRDILVASEGETFEVICDSKPLNAERCSPNGQCNLRPLWYGLRKHVDEFLVKYTLEDLLTGSHLKDFPQDSTVKINPHL